MALLYLIVITDKDRSINTTVTAYSPFVTLYYIFIKGGF